MKIITLLTTIVSSFFVVGSIFGQGVLTPLGPPAPTMKSLDQIEARTPISSAPFTITQPGSYYLTTNLTVNFGNAVNIMTNGVTLDLNGFGIISTESSAGAGSAIEFSSGLRNIAIVNGFIQGGVTNNGSGVYSGNGFGYGISYLNSPPQNVRVSGLSVSGCLYDGIFIGTAVSIGKSTLVESCTVRTVGGSGIVASTVKNSTAIDCGYSGVVGDDVSDSEGQSAGDEDGISAESALDCDGQSNGGYGLSADIALNCIGQSTSYYGLSAAYVAQNCYGSTSFDSDGLSAYTAQNCYGISQSGVGLDAETAIGCYGYSDSGVGLAAFIASVCHGATASGVAISALHNVNSY